LHIEGRKRFVHEQDAGAVDQALRQTNPLAHTAGQLMRVAILEAGQPDASDPLPRPDAGVAARRTVVAGTGRHVPQDGLPGEDGIALKDVTDALGDALDRAPFHPNVTAAR